MKNKVSIVLNLDSSFQMEYCLDDGKRVGVRKYDKDVQLIDILRDVRNLISPWNVSINILFAVTQHE